MFMFYISIAKGAQLVIILAVETNVKRGICNRLLAMITLK
jgi:hypothetical protein